MKKYLATILAAVCALSCVIALTGCNNSSSNGTSSDNKSAAKEATSSADLGDIKVGDVVTFGSYDSDGDVAKAGEATDLTWKVLAVEDGKALLITESAIDRAQFNSEISDVAWADSTLRTWMNDTFFNAAFSADEQACICATTLEDVNTTDNVFALSVDEANKYFDDDAARICWPYGSVYNGEYGWHNDGTVSDAAQCLWWLRTKGVQDGHDDNLAAYVTDSGVVMATGASVVSYNNWARPAIWVNVK